MFTTNPRLLLKRVATSFFVFCFIILSVKSFSQVSITFSSGYLGTQASATQQTNNIKNLSTLGISRVSFSQSYAGTFGGTQGNDLSGVIRLYLTSGQIISLNGALNWRETTGNNLDVFGLIFDPGQNATITYGSNQTYNIVGGSTNNTSTSLGLKAYASSVTFTDGSSRSGNAATSSIIGDINSELATSPQPSSITLTNTSVIEGQNLVYTVTLSTATTSGRPQVFTFNTSGTASKGSDFSATYTFSNGVVDNGDGTITVPGSVSSFTITVSTIDDAIVENIETLLLSVGSKTAIGSIADNDNLNIANCDPNSLYDNIVSGYHQSIAKKSDGSYSVWGNIMASNGTSHVLSPLAINSTNYSAIGSSTILKSTVAGGASSSASQAIVLTTDGLYAWGAEGNILDATLTAGTSFAKIATPTGGDATTKLPTGVTPGSVKMMASTYQTLMIVTNSGNVWVLTQTNGELRGVGTTTAAAATWNKVKIDGTNDLNNVIAVRGMVDDATHNGIMALTADGKAYVWGKSIYLGDGSAVTSKSYATLMTLPTEFSITNIPKMIAVTGGSKTTTAVINNTFYILSNSGTLYGLGDNQKKQIGDFTTTERKTWTPAKINSTTNFTDVNFISAMESDPSDPAVVIITKSGDMYTWGFNAKNMIGRPTADASYDPGIPGGFLQGTDKAIFAEMGGHTLVYIKQGSSQFCYVGHRVNGSMGDGTTTDATETTFNCSGTPSLSVCGSVPVTASTVTSTISASPTSILANGTSTSIITVQLKQSNGTNLTTTGGTVIINTNKGSISSVTDNNDGTYTAILTSSTFVETANITYTLNGTSGTNSATVNFTNTSNPTITTSGTLNTFTTCSGCTIAPQSFVVSGTDLSTNNIVVTAPTGVQVSTSNNSGFATSINITPSAGSVTNTTVYVKLVNSATSASSGVISITSTGANSKTITVTTNTDNALNFDGTDAINIGQPITSGSSYTMEAWVNYQPPGGNNTASNIISSYNNPFFISTDNKLYAGVGLNYTVVSSPATIPSNKWTHVAVTFDNTTNSMLLYVNGVQVASGTSVSGFTLSGSEPLYIGSHTGTSPSFSPTSFFKGNIDEVRIWNSVRSATDIQNNMFTELVGNESNLKSYYNFNQGVIGASNTSITTTTDLSSTANNASLSAFTLTGSTSNFVAGFIPAISAAGSATSVAVGSTLQLSNGLTGGTWSSSNSSLGTVNTSGLVTGIAAGSITISYTICNKVSSFNLTVTQPSITTSGTLPTITSCSGCTVNPPSFIVSGSYLTADITLTAPTGFVLATTATGTYSTTLTLTQNAGSVTNTSVFVKLTNNTIAATSGTITLTSTGAAPKTITATVNTDNSLNFVLTAPSDYVQTNSPIFANGQANLTIEAWLKPNAGSFDNQYHGFIGVQGIVGTNSSRNPSLYIYNGKVHFDSYDLSGNRYNYETTTAVLPQDTWSHVAVVKNGTTYSLYINGILNATFTAPATVKAAYNYLLGAVDNYYSGALDEVRFWNTARTSQEINANMYNELNGTETGLLSYFNFNQGVTNGTNSSVTSLTSIGSVSLTATLTNFALTGTTSNYVPGFIPNITGTTSVTSSATVTLSNALSGGVWSSANTNIATVNSNGVVTGIAAGTTSISYTFCNKTVNTLFVVTVPTITTTGTLTAFNTCASTNSSAQTFTVSAQYLTNDLILTAPSGYEIATSAGGTYSNTIAISPSSGTVSARLIYVRTTTSIVNGQSGNIAITSTGATTRNVATGNATVSQNLTASVTISSNATNNTICSGANITFTANATNGGLTPTYQWKKNGATINGATSSTYSTTGLSNNDVITVVMGSSISSCISGSPATSNGITVTVTSIPTAPGAITGPTTICMNSNQVYSVSAVAGATAYSWVVTGNLTATTSTTNVLNITADNVSGAGTIKVLASNSCGSSLYSTVLNVTVSNTPAPTASFTSNAIGSICIGSPAVTFTNTSTRNATTNSPITTYAWDLGNGTTLSTQDASGTYTNSGSYDVVMTIQDANACTSSISSRIIVDPLSVSGTATAAQSTICSGGNTSISLTGNTGTIQWMSSPSGANNFTNIVGATSNILNTGTFTSSTDYMAVVRSGSCTVATTSIVTVTVSPIPTATLSAVTGLFNNSTSFDLSYSNAVGSPNEYSISTVAPNAMPNFVAVNNYGLLGSPITVSIPASASGNYNFNLVLRNNIVGCTSSNIPFTVSIAILPPISLSYNTPNVYTAGNTITSLTPTSTGGAIASYSISPNLPAGLTLNTNTGVISGTPSAVSSQTSYIVTGTNASGTITATLDITVNAGAPGPVVQTQTDYCQQTQVSEYKYAKVVFTGVKNRNAANSIQIAEWKWFYGNTEISRSGVTVTNPGGNNPSGETPPNVYDGNTSTKWLDFNIISGNTSTLLFTFPGTGARITNYSFVTANDAEERDPSAWTVYMSNDNVNWTQVHSVSNYPAPSARFASSYNWSYANATSTVTLSATPLTGYYLRWYTTATGGTATTTAPTLNTNTAGTTTYYVSQINQALYESPRSVLTVNVNALPAAPVVVSPVNYSLGAPASALTATALTGHTLNWYTVSSGGTSTSTAYTPSTNAIGTVNFYVSQTNSTLGCEGPRATIAVITAIAAPAGLSYTTPNVYTVGTAITALNPTSTGGAIASYAISPSLPAGLTFNTTTGAISGTPTVVSTQTSYVVTGTNASGTVTATVVITVNVAAPAGLSYTTPNVYTVGTAITTLNPTSTGGAIASYAISPSLPTGLTFNTTTGAITGTPTAVSTQTSYVVTGTNASGTVTATVVITVNVAAPAGLSYTTPNVYTVGTAITTLNPTSTGGAIASYTISPSLPAGLTIDPTTGIISGNPTSASTQTSYIVTGTNGSGTVTTTIGITVNVGAPAGLIYTSPNVYTKGTAISSLNPTSTGGAISAYTVSPNLPAGLIINSSTGVISGTPTVASNQTSYVVTGTNVSGTVSATILITVNDNVQPPAAPPAKSIKYVFGNIPANTPYPFTNNSRNLPAGTIPVYRIVGATAFSTTAPNMPTAIGRYIFQVSSYDTTNQLYSTNFVNDTIVIAPPAPQVIDSTYVLGVATNPATIGVQVSGLSGATFSYYYLGALQNGTPVLGNVIGTKKYAASQTVNSVESDTASFNVTILDPANLIHLQKIVDSGILQSNSTFNYPFTLVVSNLTNTTFTNIVLTDNLQNSVPLTSEYSIVKNTANGGLKANSSFNGNSDINVTLASSTLAPQAKDTAKFTMNLVPKGYSGNLTNVAYVKANTKWGTIIMQSSSSTKANETTKLPTKYYVKDLSISIPEGFSPNHDGVHDNFVIIKPYNITLDLEVFNRWGNVVYSSSNYKNDWDGRGTGNFAGQDLVDGGYYYSLRAVDETGKVQVFKGFVIIQR
jgi:gliding motility-associated-like protein